MNDKAIKLVKRPALAISPDVFETVTLDTPELEVGQMLLKQTHMPLDPAINYESDNLEAQIEETTLTALISISRTRADRYNTSCFRA